MNNKVIKSGVWFTASNFLMKTIGFITTPIFTRLMTKAEFGDFNNIQTWMMILLYITSLNLEGSLIRASQEFKSDIDNYSFSMICLSLLSTSFFFVIINLFIAFISQIILIDTIYIEIMFIYLFFMPVVNLFQNSERFKFKYKNTVLTSMFISVGASLLSVVLVIFLKDKLLGRTVGYVIPTLFVGAIVIIYYLKNKCKCKIVYWKYALPIALPYLPHLLSMYLLSNMDRVMIKMFCGSEKVALYSIAYICGTLMSILVTSVNNAFSPWLAERLQQKEYKKIYRVSFPYVFIFCVISIGAVLFTPEILMVLGGESYMEARFVMAPVAAGCLLQCVYCLYVNIEQFEKKTKGMALASVFVAIENGILNYIFIPKFGYIAAAYTTYIGYLTLLILHILLVKKIGLSFVYATKRILILSILTSFLVFSISFTFTNNILRISLIFIYLLALSIILLKKRELILSIIRR